MRIPCSPVAGPGTTVTFFDADRVSDFHARAPSGWNPQVVNEETMNSNSADGAIRMLDKCTAIMMEVAMNTLRDVKYSQDEFEGFYDRLTQALNSLSFAANPLPWRDLG